MKIYQFYNFYAICLTSSDFHVIYIISDDVAIFFGRSPLDNCQDVSPTVIPTMQPVHWQIAPLMGDETMTFTMRMGAAGGTRGYSGITGILSTFSLVHT